MNRSRVRCDALFAELQRLVVAVVVNAGQLYGVVLCCRPITGRRNSMSAGSRRGYRTLSVGRRHRRASCIPVGSHHQPRPVRQRPSAAAATTTVDVSTADTPATPRARRAARLLVPNFRTSAKVLAETRHMSI